MSGRITYEPAERHQCEPGERMQSSLQMGTIWTCDDCGGDWMWIPPASLTAHQPPDGLVDYWVEGPGLPERRHRRKRWWQR
jgi:hypothetical protein